MAEATRGEVEAAEAARNTEARDQPSAVEASCSPAAATRDGAKREHGDGSWLWKQ
jgi:hypothetical protein